MSEHAVPAETAGTIQDAIVERFPDEVLCREAIRGEDIVTLRPDRLQDIFEFLKDEQQIDFLADITAVDCLHLDRPWDFEVVYQMVATGQDFFRMTLKVGISGRTKPSLTSAVNHWQAAGWAEREVMEMFGIVFDGHPDPRKLLLPDNFEHHPLRKDYPLKGLGERDSFPVIRPAFEGDASKDKES